MDKALLTIEEFAEMHGLGRTKVYDLLRRGEIESVKIGTSRRITRAAAAAFVERLAQSGSIE